MPESVGRARQFAASTVAAWGADDLEDDVRVAASELATNALLHARTEFTLGLSLDGDRLRLTMVDGSPLQPRMRRFDSTESTTGRGLRMVRDLAQAWGVERDGVGKAVWCEFPIHSGAAAGRPDASAQVHPDGQLVEEDIEALLARYDDDDGGVPRVQLSSCSSARTQLVVRVVA
jgi:anti-sigma regulatory factor (Ser/Thr protein kinase)